MENDAFALQVQQRAKIKKREIQNLPSGIMIFFSLWGNN